MRAVTRIARQPTIHDLDGKSTFYTALIEGLAPDPSLPLDEWSEQYMVIPRSTGAAEYGKYRLDRTPHAREIMRCLSDRHPSRRVVLMAASQILKTQIALNWFCYIVHQHPSNFVWLMPTGKLQKRIVIRIDKTIASVDVVRPRVSPPGSRLATNSQDIKAFQGGTLYIVTAGSAANLAEVPARYVSFDEIDRADDSVDGEGDPVKLAEARQTTFANTAKSYYYSSPTIKDESRIEALYLEGTQRVALAECIHCGHAQELIFENLVLGESGQALYPCEQCGGIHRDSDKQKMFQNGLWSDAKTESKTESFLFSAMFQPYGWFSWTDLYNQHQEALIDLDRGIEHQMIVFHNTRLARSWKRTTDITKFEILRDRAEDYRLRIAPEGVLIITAGVDTQDNRLAVQIVGYGKYLRAWVLDYIELMGDPAEDDVWDQLTKLLNTKIQHVSGHEIPISATLIDTGGHRGEAVKNYVRSKRINNPIAGYGAVKINARPLGKGTMQDVNWKGTLDKKGIMLHAVGTIEIKHVLFSRLKNYGEKNIEDRMIHFSSDLDDYYFAGVLSETYDNKKKRYVNKPGIRNEPLDTLVYSFAALHHQRIRADRFTENDWNKYLFRVNNPQAQKNLTTNATELQKQAAPRRDSRFGGFKERFSSRFGRRR